MNDNVPSSLKIIKKTFFFRDFRHGNYYKVVVAPKISLWKKKFFYDFKTGNYIISHVICKERHSFY